MDTWIQLKDCIDGHLYAIDARNAPLGVFLAKEKSFLISRFKFKENYLYLEEHWDCGEPHGTAKPLQDLGPIDLTPFAGWRWNAEIDKKLCIYLNQLEEEKCPDE